MTIEARLEFLGIPVPFSKRRIDKLQQIKMPEELSPKNGDCYGIPMHGTGESLNGGSQDRLELYTQKPQMQKITKSSPPKNPFRTLVGDQINKNPIYVRMGPGLMSCFFRRRIVSSKFPRSQNLSR